MSQNESDFKLTGEMWMPLDKLNGLRQRYDERCDLELPTTLISNLISNILYLKTKHELPGVNTLEGRHPGRPAVIVGLGPSLDKHLKMLTSYRERFLIITGDAALPVLIKNGITPDYVGMIDPYDKQANNFKDIDLTKFTTVVPNVVHPKVLEILDPEHTLMYNLAHKQSALHNVAPTYTGDLGSYLGAALTTGTAFQMAVAMKCEPMAFVGHDLSWPSIDKVYAKDAFEWKCEFQKQVKFKSDCLLFPDIYGKLVLTHFTFMIFWGWIRDYLKTHKILDVYNCSEAGILQTDELKAIPFHQFVNEVIPELAHGRNTYTRANCN